MGNVLMHKTCTPNPERPEPAHLNNVATTRRGEMKRILCHFGYVKVPKEAVQLSLLQEGKWEQICAILPDWKFVLEGQRRLTNFLQSGRMLNNE
jgi:hypothetical protein